MCVINFTTLSWHCSIHLHLIYSFCVTAHLIGCYPLDRTCVCSLLQWQIWEAQPHSLVYTYLDQFFIPLDRMYTHKQSFSHLKQTFTNMASKVQIFKNAVLYFLDSTGYVCIRH